MNGPLGHVTLRPGPSGAVLHQRPVGWLGRLAQGRCAQALPALMASVHTLCAHGHWLAARLALRAAQGEDARATPAERHTLALAVVRDHLLCLAHDWPRLLPTGGEPLPLADAPPWRPGLNDVQRLALLPVWLRQHWLHEPASALLAALQAQPAEAALAWARRGPSALARLLAAELPPALALATPSRTLSATLPLAELALPAHAVPDTGAWCRAQDSAAPPAHNAGMRLIARLTDLLRLAAPTGADWLQASGQALAPGRGRAWVEVGRGRLGYELTLAPGSGPPTVQALQVLSPTDWNLHPAGVLAEALRQVDGHDAATRLAVAFDPCVPFRIEPGMPTRPEAAHA